MYLDHPVSRDTKLWRSTAADKSWLTVCTFCSDYKSRNARCLFFLVTYSIIFFRFVHIFQHQNMLLAMSKIGRTMQCGRLMRHCAQLMVRKMSKSGARTSLFFPLYPRTVKESSHRYSFLPLWHFMRTLCQIRQATGFHSQYSSTLMRYWLAGQVRSRHLLATWRRYRDIYIYRNADR